jgi:hypothetical protein
LKEFGVPEGSEKDQKDPLMEFGVPSGNLESPRGITGILQGGGSGPPKGNCFKKNMILRFNLNFIIYSIIKIIIYLIEFNFSIFKMVFLRSFWGGVFCYIFINKNGIFL